MPIFEFQCKACSHEFESLMRPYDPVECPRCLVREAQSEERGKFVKKITNPSQQIYKCSTEGAMPMGRSRK